MVMGELRARGQFLDGQLVGPVQRHQSDPPLRAQQSTISGSRRALVSRTPKVHNLFEIRFGALKLAAPSIPAQVLERQQLRGKRAYCHMKELRGGA